MSDAIDNRNGLVDALLHEQQSLTAVDRFAQAYQQNGKPAGEKYYRDLIPTGPPGEGEQYAFEVNLDECSGCKACVVACHNLNGLEPDETWRRVGLLVGGYQLPIVQHVTTACHHCVEPACASGCPVEAYEKDEKTGIVRHLDDQCIGCQYCMLKCPYDVPVYSREKGIVRKCDMCHQRLEAGEAPMCVQACPNQAIKIRIVDKQQIREESEAHSFLPAAPDPAYTLPTTEYVSDRVMPRNTLPADYYAVQRAHGHFALVVMLVLTQMSVGAFVAEQAMQTLFAQENDMVAAAVRPWHLLAAWLLGMLGLAASIFHLGRPFYAYRALLGLRTSWLSREILAFNVFAGSATAFVSAALLSSFGYYQVSTSVQQGIGSVASLAGIAAVMCSVMIYVDTRRPLWTFAPTTAKFLLTSALLGLPTTLLISLFTAAFTEGLTVRMVMEGYGREICQLLMVVAGIKLCVDASILFHSSSSQLTPHKRSALLLTGELGNVTLRRFWLGVVGGMVIPTLIVGEMQLTADGFSSGFLGAASIAMLGLLLIGELHERFLFFAASVAPTMPGAPA